MGDSGSQSAPVPQGVGGPPATGGPPAEGAAGLLWNLVLLSLLGVGISVWVWFYTEWFPVVASLLGLGGVFTWLAFLSGLLLSSRKQQLQEMLDRLLSARWLRVAMVVGLLLAIAAASLFGAVVVRSPSDRHDRTVAVSSGTQPVDPGARAVGLRQLLPRSQRTLLVWTGWEARPVRVRVSGLPPAPLVLRPFERRIVDVPSSFRSAVALEVSPRVAMNLKHRKHELVVLRNGVEIASLPAGSYRGQAAWVGAAPEGADLREALVVLPEVALERGDHLSIEARREDGGVYVAGEVDLVAAIPDNAVAHVKLVPRTEGVNP